MHGVGGQPAGQWPSFQVKGMRSICHLGPMLFIPELTIKVSTLQVKGVWRIVSQGHGVSKISGCSGSRKQVKKKKSISNHCLLK